jgi:hypothetical protein
VKERDGKSREILYLRFFFSVFFSDWAFFDAAALAFPSMNAVMNRSRTIGALKPYRICGGLFFSFSSAS